jgi:hypothetical protein
MSAGQFLFFKNAILTFSLELLKKTKLGNDPFEFTSIILVDPLNLLRKYVLIV